MAMLHANIVQTTKIILGCLVLIPLISAEIYYIIPTSNHTCPNENVTCLTLLEYAQQSLSEFNFGTSSTLMFTPGNHHLNQSIYLTSTQLLLQVSNNSSLLAAMVTCNSFLWLTFEGISELSITSLKFNGCSLRIMKSVDQFSLDGCSFHTGYGIRLIAIKNATIKRSSFVSLTTLSYQALGPLTTELSNVFISECLFDGNMGSYSGSIYSKGDNIIAIHSSNFTNNTARRNNGGALYIATFHNANATKLIRNVVINECLFHQNIAGASYGYYRSSYYRDDVIIAIHNSNFTENVGGVIVAIYDAKFRVSIHNCEFNGNRANNTDTFSAIGGAAIQTSGDTNTTLRNSVFIDNTATDGAAIRIGSSFSQRNKSYVDIHNCEFIGNRAVVADGGAIQIIDDTNITLVIHKSLFVDNTAENGAAIQIGGSDYRYYQRKTSFLAIEILNCEFFSNVAESRGGAIAIPGGKISFTSVFINNSKFINNSAQESGGAIKIFYYSLSSGKIETHYCEFISNTAEGGGAIDTHGGAKIAIYYCKFISNKAFHGGAILISGDSNITVQNSIFVNSTAIWSGGVIYIAANNITSYSSLIINNSMLTGNTAKDGGAIVIRNLKYGVHIAIHNSQFFDNKAQYGGAISISCKYAIIALCNSEFTKNKAEIGGAIDIQYGIVVLNNKYCRFIDNTAIMSGGAIHAWSTNLTVTGILTLTRHTTQMTGIIFVINSIVLLSGNTTISKNTGSVYAFSSNVTFGGYTIITNNEIQIEETSIQEGGALTSFQSDILFRGKVFITYNQVSNGSGGAILSIESKINAYGDTLTISKNTALSGGGIYAYQSELNFNSSNNTMRDNTATKKGGGIYALGTSIKLTGGRLQFIQNKAERGGGICLDLNTKLYVIKTELEYVIDCTLFPEVHDCEHVFAARYLKYQFINNSADYGGALHISDNTNTGVCSAHIDQSTSSECFLRVVALHSFIYNLTSLRNIYFTGNSATSSGRTIFGGLLDRCTVSPYDEIFSKHQNLSPSSLNAITYLMEVTDLTAPDIQNEISSDPVRVCICEKGQPDCSNYLSPNYQLKKGQTIQISIVAVDQVNNPVPSEIRAFLSSHDGGLGEGQDIQSTTLQSNCTELNYTISSPYDSDQLVLYAVGPCNDVGISETRINLKFLPCSCPLGFLNKEEPSNCVCDCDPVIYPDYIASCSIANESIQRENNKWVDYINISSQVLYMIHTHCPFDYCRPSTEQVWINLNVPKGADAQCAFNRSGKLCGSCEEGLSLSLGSSSCMHCSNHWLALTIVFIIAGIALVAFILKCNLTVAVGTINGLIFYVNIIAANHAIFLPFDKPNILTIFISWLNLDFGFETCFYNGMDGYAKTWLQFAFPLYIISLVVAIVVLSNHFSKFAALFTKGTDPIATLATLILLSYTKLIRTIIASLSFTRLKYSDGSHEVVWLTDANVQYLKGKHIPLFITALAIVIIAMMYTLLLFGWQWINMLCPKIWITQNTKLNSFMDSYHNPFNKDHRYWIGLLLLVRVLLYLVSAVNVLGDPRINLLSINTAVVILLFIEAFPGHKITKRKHIFIIENIALFNLIGFTIVTYYTFTDAKQNQVVVAYVSTTFAFITFLVVLIYHTCKYALGKQIQKLKSLFTKHENDHSLANQIPLSPPTNTTMCYTSNVSETVIDHPETYDTHTLMNVQRDTQTDDEMEQSAIQETSHSLDNTLVISNPTNTGDDLHNLLINNSSDNNVNDDEIPIAAPMNMNSKFSTSLRL